MGVFVKIQFVSAVFLERDPGFGGGLSTRFEVLLKVGTVIRLDETVGTAGTTFVLVLFGCWTFFNCSHFLKGSHHLRFWMGLHFRFEWHFLVI